MYIYIFSLPFLTVCLVRSDFVHFFRCVFTCICIVVDPMHYIIESDACCYVFSVHFASLYVELVFCCTRVCLCVLCTCYWVWCICVCCCNILCCYSWCFTPCATPAFVHFFALLLLWFGCTFVCFALSFELVDIMHIHCCCSPSWILLCVSPYCYAPVAFCYCTLY